MLGTGQGFRRTHVAALALAAIMLPWSEFLLSNAQFLLVGNWLIEGIVRKDLGGRFRRAFTHPGALVFMSFFGLHALGLLWTEDPGWGQDLCRILLPVIAFTPVLASVPPLRARELRTVLLLGAWSTVASTLVCLALRGEVLAVGGYRELSIFISHIRLALLLCFSAAVFAVMAGRSALSRLAHMLAIAWCIVFLALLRSLPGFAMLAVMAAYGIWRWGAERGVAVRWSVRAALLLIPLAAAAWAYGVAKEFRRGDATDLALLDERSAGGEYYYHDRERPLLENGHYVWINVADSELMRGWERRSALRYHGVDARGDTLRHTLVRYLASKGLRKDSTGILQLSGEDVRRVENGVPSAEAGHKGPLRARLEQILYEWDEYKATGDASGHSTAMRREFARTGWAIAREHPLIGTGTGGTRPAFAEMYARTASTLDARWRLRAHDQYLTLLISFGFTGLLWSLFSWWWPAHRKGAFRRPLFVCWAVIFSLSCLGEDTLETQPGATFFALFYALLVFAYPVDAISVQAGPAPGAERSA